MNRILFHRWKIIRFSDIGRYLRFVPKFFFFFVSSPTNTTMTAFREIFEKHVKVSSPMSSLFMALSISSSKKTFRGNVGSKYFP